MEERSSFPISVGEILYYCMFGILLFSKAIGWYDGMTQFKVVLVISTALFACKLLVTRQTWRDWVLVLCVCTLAAVVYGRSGDKSLLLYAYMMLGMKDVPVRRTMKWAMAVWTVGFIGLTSLCAFGVLPEKILVHPKHLFGYVICHALGYAHPNTLHVSYVLFAALILYLVDETGNRRLLWTASFLVLVGNIIVFMNSISFTGALIVLFLLAINLYLQLRGTVSCVESFLLQCILPVCLVFSLIGPLVLYGTRLFDLINKAMNTRYNLTYYFLTEQPITLFGSRLVVPNYRYTMDCSYTFLLVQLGIIPFALVVGSLFLLIHDALREHRYAEAAMVIAFCVGGVSEPFLFNTSFKNMTFVFLGAYVYRKLAAKREEGRSLLSPEVPTRLQTMIGHVVSSVTGMVRSMLSALERCAALAPIAFVGVTIILSAVLFCVNPWATSIYVPDEWHDNQSLEQLSLSDNDVAEILANHGEIIGEESQYAEMVECESDTLRVENACKSVNAAALIAAVIGIGCLYVCCKEQGARQSGDLRHDDNE